ncbi:MAG: NADPH-dependent FMN reductase [Thermoleophilia bacterium]
MMGSTRRGRFSERPARWIHAMAAKRDGLDAELIDLREYQLPFFDEPVTPSAARESYTDPEVVRWTEKVKQGDGYIIVAPEYNHGYPAVLKNAIDYVFEAWHGKPVGFVSYGSAMGARSVEQLRLVSVELRMMPIRDALHIPPAIFNAARAVDEAEALSLLEPLREPAGILLDQLTLWAGRLKSVR